MQNNGYPAGIFLSIIGLKMIFVMYQKVLAASGQKKFPAQHAAGNRGNKINTLAVRPDDAVNQRLRRKVHNHCSIFALTSFQQFLV